MEIYHSNCIIFSMDSLQSDRNTREKQWRSKNSLHCGLAQCRPISESCTSCKMCMYSPTESYGRNNNDKKIHFFVSFIHQSFFVDCPNTFMHQCGYDCPNAFIHQCGCNCCKNLKSFTFRPLSEPGQRCNDILSDTKQDSEWKPRA